MPFARLTPTLFAIFCIAAPPLSAEVRLEVLPDGTKRMVGSGSVSPKVADKSWSPRRSPRARKAPAELEGWIHEEADRWALDPNLIRAIIQVESSFDPSAKSHKGAMGLMQLMPQTAASLAVSDPYDPRQNIRGGAAYLRKMLSRFGRTELALAAYNAGPGAVDRYGGIPPYAETRRYVEKVLRIHRHDPAFSLPNETVRPRSSSKRRTYLYRDPSGSLVMTTEPPG